MKNLPVIFCFLFISLFTTRCVTTGSDCGDGTSSLADLISKCAALLFGDKDVKVGDVVDVAVDVANVIDSNNECGETETSDPSDYEMQVFYRADANSTFEPIGTATYAVDAIPAGGRFEDLAPFTFLKSGEYHIGVVADASKNVKERNENNNGSQSQNVSDRSASFAGSIIKVAESNDRVKKSGSGYFIPLPKSNLIRFESKPVTE